MDKTTWKHGSISHLVTKRKVNKQLTNQHSALSATCCSDRAGYYSDLGCATQQQPMTDVQQKSRSKVAQQKSTIYVCHHTCVINFNKAYQYASFCAFHIEKNTFYNIIILHTSHHKNLLQFFFSNSINPHPISHTGMLTQQISQFNYFMPKATLHISQFN